MEEPYIFLFEDDVSQQDSAHQRQLIQGAAWASLPSTHLLRNDTTGFYYMGKIFARFGVILLSLTMVFQLFLIFKLKGVSAFENWRFDLYSF